MATHHANTPIFLGGIGFLRRSKPPLGELDIPRRNHSGATEVGEWGMRGWRCHLYLRGLFLFGLVTEEIEVIPPIPLCCNQLRPSGSRRGHPPPLIAPLIPLLGSSSGTPFRLGRWCVPLRNQQQPAPPPSASLPPWGSHPSPGGCSYRGAH